MKKGREILSSSSILYHTDIANLKEVGQHAIRLEEEPTKLLGAKIKCINQAERLKRPEIVRISESINSRLLHKDDRNVIAKATKSHVRSKRIVYPRVQPQLTRQHGHRCHAKDPVWDCEVASTNGAIDLWIPDVSHLLSRSEDDTPMGRFVILHGLPYSCTSLMIRKFFSGLKCERVLILIRHHRGIHVIDADYESIRNDQEGVNRYLPTTLRVLVQFESSPIAQLAAERSGETLQLLEGEFFPLSSSKLARSDSPSNFSDVVSRPVSVKGVTIAVTQLQKLYSSTLDRFVSIEVKKCDGNVPLHLLEESIRKDLISMVPLILWTHVHKVLNILVPPPTGSRDNRVIYYAPLLQRNATNRSLRQFATLRRDHHHLMNEFRPWILHMDPIVSQIDPVARLYQSALECLHSELNRFDEKMKKRRVRQSLLSLSTSKNDSPSCKAST